MKPHLKKTLSGWCAWLSREDQKNEPPVIIGCNDKKEAFRQVENFALINSLLKNNTVVEARP